MCTKMALSSQITLKKIAIFVQLIWECGACRYSTLVTKYTFIYFFFFLSLLTIDYFHDFLLYVFLQNYIFIWAVYLIIYFHLFIIIVIFILKMKKMVMSYWRIVKIIQCVNNQLLPTTT